jgi:catechol 2,3-dioxygenase-like lactoylglutathione lyase family enzyme
MHSKEDIMSATDSTNFLRAAPPWRGFHHVALVTPDLDATIALYRDVLGMEIGDVLTMGTMEARHCFIKPGDSETWGLHFFEHPDAEVHQYPEGLNP